MKKRLPYNTINLQKNTSPQQTLLLLLLLDTSGSMNEAVEVVDEKEITKLQLLNAAYQRFIEALSTDPISRKSVELGLITFNSEVKTVRDFSTFETVPDVLPSFTASGVTRIGEAVCTATQQIHKRYEVLLNKGETNTLTPVMVVLSDGYAFESSPDAMQEAVKACSSKVFHTIPIFIGKEEENPAFLNEIGNPINVNQLMIGELFDGILSATKSSLSTASSSAFSDLLQSAISWSMALADGNT